MAKLLVVVTGSLVLMALDHRFHQMESLRAVLSVVVYPVQSIVNAPVSACRTLSESLTARQALLSDNDRLRAQNLLLKTRLQRFAALESENMRLRELLDSSVEVGEKALVADLLSVEVGTSGDQVVINKGSQHGIFLGQPVVDADGVMGQVTHVGPFTSVAMLVTDPKHALPVQINRNGVRAIAEGTGAMMLELRYLPRNADVKLGDLIISSGLGGRFPAGYPVGEVTRVQRLPGDQFVKVTAVPKAKLSRSQQVLLLWPQEHPAAVADIPRPLPPTP